MSYRSMREFLSILESEKKLVKVNQPINTVLEMTEISTRLLANKGPAVLYENPIKADGSKSSMPVLNNLFGTVERVAMGVTMGNKQRRTAKDLREVGELLAFLREPTPPANMKEAFSLLPLAKTVMSMRPSRVSGFGKAPCQEMVFQGDDIDLNMLPIQTCWPNEPAPLVTWPLVVTKGFGGEKTDKYNLGIYRMQQLSKDKLIMRWLHHRGGALQFQRYKKLFKEPFPVAIVLGADPGTILAAVTPIPDTLSEYQFAGILRGQKLELTPCKTIPIEVPAHAEIIIEGHVMLDEEADEGPYGDHTGYYNSVEKFPVFKASCITMRKDPIYLSTFTGRPPDEPSVLGEALNEVFIPLLQNQFPEIVDFWLPPEGCSYRIAVISMKKAYAGHAKRVMMGAWSYLRQFMYTKWIIVVDDDIDARDWKDVMWALSTRMDPVRDTVSIENTPIDYLDFASPFSGLGGKIGLDATNKIGNETNREWGQKIQMDKKIIDDVTQKWSSLGFDFDAKPIWK